MSLEIVRQVSAEHPDLLRTNLVSTCYQHTVFVIEKLRAAGHQTFHVCKTDGESHYTPAGFAPRDVTGLDGKTYRCVGVSPDAIWSDGTIVDTIASANENDRPIYHRQGDPNWSFDPNDGPQIVGAPVWNVVPPNNWRPQNPPLKDGAPTPTPTPVPAFPSYEDIGGDSFGRAMIGVPLQADYLQAGQTLNDGSAVWFYRAIYRLLRALVLANGQPIDALGEVKIVRNEWRKVLGLPPLP